MCESAPAAFVTTCAAAGAAAATLPIIDATLPALFVRGFEFTTPPLKRRWTCKARVVTGSLLEMIVPDYKRSLIPKHGNNIANQIPFPPRS